MRYIFLFSLLALSAALSADDKIKVISIEYPPFINANSDDFGTNFVLLKKYADSNFKVGYEPYFVPPARAQLLIELNQWCLSFYPPKKPGAYRFVPLSDEKVRLGLYRREQPTPFNYTSLNELKGKVAVLRSISLGKIYTELSNAGLQLVSLETVEQGIRMLLAGRVDYAFGDNTTVLTYLDIPEIETLQFGAPSLHEAEVGFFIHQSCEADVYKSFEN